MEDKKNINIYLESNPNPNSLKFVADVMLVPPGSNYDFADKESAASAPLAEELFGYDFVKRVFYMSNFITVTKSEEISWPEIQDVLKNHIKSYIESGKPILSETGNTGNQEENISEVGAKVKTLLEEYVRPAVEQDGGAIEYHSYKDGVVKVLLQGSCSGCPSAMITLKSGIENLLKSMIPEVQAVEAEEM